jgi:hypothetical protein
MYLAHGSEMPGRKQPEQDTIAGFGADGLYQGQAAFFHIYDGSGQVLDERAEVGFMPNEQNAGIGREAFEQQLEVAKAKISGGEALVRMERFQTEGIAHNFGSFGGTRIRAGINGIQTQVEMLHPFGFAAHLFFAFLGKMAFRVEMTWLSFLSNSMS